MTMTRARRTPGESNNMRVILHPVSKCVVNIDLHMIPFILFYLKTTNLTICYLLVSEVVKSDKHDFLGLQILYGRLYQLLLHFRKGSDAVRVKEAVKKFMIR